jgi:hypothetical protein
MKKKAMEKEDILLLTVHREFCFNLGRTQIARVRRKY